MPYKLSENGLCVVKADTGETVKCHENHEEALAHLRALEANVPDAKSMNRKARMADMRQRIQQVHDHAAAALEHLNAMLPMEPEEDDAGKSAPDTVTQTVTATSGGTTTTYVTVTNLDNASLTTEPARKGLDFSYAKSLGLSIPENVLAVKYVGRDEIRGYTFLWGNPEMRDMEREFFTQNTDFWDEQLKNFERPLTWDHAQDADWDPTESPIIGSIKSFGDDEWGRWYSAKLKRHAAYRKYLDELIEQGVLGSSSDSLPQYVLREQTGKATWLKQWPWFATALTDVPCEPRLIGSLEIFKSLGITLPDAPPPAAWEWDTARLTLAHIQS